jgi:uncharacterized damage-inducible protein DinB
MAHVAELPGCFAVGSTASKAVAAMPKAIADFLLWLRRHGEPLVPEAYVSRPSTADLYVAEVRSGGAPTMAGDRASMFDYDLVAWDDAKLERTLRWLGYSRAQLLAKIQGLTEEDMRTRLIAPHRTLKDTLWHVANAEYGYINRVTGPLEGIEPVTETEPSDVRQRLAIVRDILVRRARAVPPEKRGEVIYPVWAARPDEPWTLQKALRRALEHELEHLAEIP